MFVKCEKTADDSQTFLSFYQQLNTETEKNEFNSGSTHADEEDAEELNFQSPLHILNYLKRIEMQLYSN
jgi:hypothetical protein